MPFTFLVLLFGTFQWFYSSPFIQICCFSSHAYIFLKEKKLLLIYAYFQQDFYINLTIKYVDKKKKTPVDIFLRFPMNAI